MCIGDSDGPNGRRQARRVDAEPTRRRVLRASAVGIGASLAGCVDGFAGDGGGDAPDPVSLADERDCDSCGMVIGNHPGPNGQLFFEGEGPAGHENPARFDSLKRCFFPYRLERERRGRTVVAGYVTDYSAVEYDVSTRGGAATISSHADAASFARAEELRYVVDSDVEGAMGPDFVPFSEAADAESFADEYGGRVVGYEDIDEGLLAN